MSAAALLRMLGFAALLRTLGFAALLAATSPTAALTLRDVQALAFAPAPLARVPADTRFVDEQGSEVAIGSYFRDRPAILVPGYYGCSNLCGVVLHALARRLADAGLHPGRDVDVVAVSIAPLETPADARLRMVAVLGSAPTIGWHFLTGPDAAIATLSTALGYRAIYDAASASYAHPAGVTVVGPGGMVRAMLPGVDFDPATLRAAIVGRQEDARPARPWLLCFHDAIAGGGHDAAAMAAVRAVGIGTLAALVGFVVLSRRRRLPKARA